MLKAHKSHKESTNGLDSGAWKDIKKENQKNARFHVQLLMLNNDDDQERGCS